MGPFQLWLHDTLVRGTSAAAFLRTDWGWPTVESAHFIGLTLLFGAIAVWDLRLLGMGKRIPITAFHRLVPFAVVGFAINAVSGSMFLMTEPNQYLYNPAFHVKVLLFLLAGLNVLVFYAFVFRRVGRLAPGVDGPRFVKIFRGIEYHDDGIIAQQLGVALRELCRHPFRVPRPERDIQVARIVEDERLSSNG
jgi:hypothetical protein